jgi:4-amino-4-deoxy-L-arabinose transferase-like glycosyltransferase
MKMRVQRKKLQERMEGWIMRRRNKWLSERPFSEWRLPLMVLAVSGMVFILLTAMFGVTVDTRSGQLNWSLEVGDDWKNPVVGKSNEDANHVNPMTQFPWFCFLAMILGYFLAVGLFIIGWFDYLKWKTILVEKHTKEVKKND